MSDKSKDVHPQQQNKEKVKPGTQGKKLHEAAGGMGNLRSEGSSNGSNTSLATGSKNFCNMFVMSKKREQMLERIKKRQHPGHVGQMQEYKKPKGKTYKKGHYDPKEVDEARANQILDKRQRNDSKPGKILRNC